MSIFDYLNDLDTHEPTENTKRMHRALLTHQTIVNVHTTFKHTIVRFGNMRTACIPYVDTRDLRSYLYSLKLPNIEHVIEKLKLN
jgi:hypothetical protein